MGYQETVVGFGSNHLDVGLCMIFKKIMKESIEINLDHTLLSLEEESWKGPYTATLQDDLYIKNKDDPYIRGFKTKNEFEFVFENIDEIGQFIRHCTIMSTQYNCQYYEGCCFAGIVVVKKGLHEEAEGLDDLEETIKNAKLWLKELQDQGRFPKDVKLVVRDNCCS